MGDSTKEPKTMGDIFQSVGGWMNGGELGYPSFGSMSALRVFVDRSIRAYLAAQPVTPSPQVAEGAELPKITGDIRIATLLSEDGHFAIAASRRAAGGEALVSPDEWAALCRFRECCDDFDSGGHDVDKAMMRRLERIGVVRSTGFGRHEMTDFGNWLHDHKEAPAPASAGQAAPVPLVAKLTALRNEAEAERQSETDTSRKHICEGMSLAFGAAAILAAQPAEGAGQAGQVAKWHAPGMGEVHYHDHSLMIDCQREIDDPSQDYIADDELAKRVCAALNATERAAAPADLHKRVIQFALDLAEHENDDAVVSFLKAWNSEDVGYLRSNWPDFDATHQPSAQDGGN